MKNYVLSPGTMLDGRYRIESVLGEGGFGITYSAVKTGLELKVAVKEFFWNGHAVRDTAVSDTVEPLEGDDGKAFHEQKARFLREARIIRDFSGEAGIVRVLDYFEQNGTAYIVMEYVEGETLSQKVSGKGTIPPEELFRRFLPLIRSLDRIHGSGILHRDISPDNIIEQPDGTLKLIDFGAAKAFEPSKVSVYGSVTKEGFAPPELYNVKGKTGPWTDVYALSATLYYCVTGIAPDTAVQRLCLDELRAPSELGITIDRKYEAVIMRGLEMDASKRFQSMHELEEAITAVLPKEKPARRSAVWYVVLSAILLLGIALGCFFFALRMPKEKFKGIRTETFYVSAPNGMTAKGFSESRKEIETILEEFAGTDNYVITIGDAEIKIELPLDCFKGVDIGTVINERFGTLLKEKGLSYTYQIQPNWEDPETSVIAGVNQVRAEALEGNTAVFAYKLYDDPASGQRANVIVDMKTRLDALGAPYAFGTVYGNENELVFRIDPGRIGRFVVDTVAKPYPLSIAGECTTYRNRTVYRNQYDSFSVKEYEDGTFGIYYKLNDPDDLKKLSEFVLSQGWNKLYLQGENNTAIAEAVITQPIENGEIEFRTFRLEGVETIDAEHRYIVDYLDALINKTDLPTVSILKSGEGMWGPEGDLLFDEKVSDHFGWRIRLKDNSAELLDVLLKMQEDTGYSIGVSENRAVYFIHLGLAQDGHLVENIRTIVPKLISDYRLNTFFTTEMLIILPVEEYSDELFRIVLRTTVDFESGKICHEASYLMTGEGRLAPYAEAFSEWWQKMPWAEYGYKDEANQTPWKRA